MPAVQDALTDAVLRTESQREVDGQLYYGEAHAVLGEAAVLRRGQQAWPLCCAGNGAGRCRGCAGAAGPGCLAVVRSHLSVCAASQWTPLLQENHVASSIHALPA